MANPIPRCAFAAFAILAWTALPAVAVTTFVPIIVPVAPPTPVSQTGDYSRIHNVAVVSAVGDYITLHNDHLLNPKDKPLDIRDWNIDASVETQLRHYLSSLFTFKDIMYDRSALAKLPNGPWDNSAKFTDLMKLLPHDGVDTFIVVRPDLERNTPGLQGIALENTGNNAILWTNYEIDLVGAEDGKLIAKASSRIALRNGVPVSFAGVPVGSSMMLGDDFNLTPQQTVTLRATVNQTINISLIETLRPLNFSVVLPKAGARTIFPIPPDRNPYKNYKNVAVVSGLGDSIEMHHAATALSQDHFTLSEPDWHLDTVVEDRVRAALAPHFHVVDPKVDRAAFAKAQLLDDTGKAAPSFPGLSSDPGIDLYVVFVKFAQISPIIGFPKMTGLGVANLNPLVGQETTNVYANYAVAVIDAHTMKLLGARAALFSPDHASPQPLEDIGNQNWPANPPALSDAQAKAIHDAFVDVLNQSVDESLLQLALLGVVAIEGAPPQIAAASTAPASVAGP